MVCSCNLYPKRTNHEIEKRSVDPSNQQNRIKSKETKIESIQTRLCVAVRSAFLTVWCAIKHWHHLFSNILAQFHSTSAISNELKPNWKKIGQTELSITLLDSFFLFWKENELTDYVITTKIVSFQRFHSLSFNAIAHHSIWKRFWSPNWNNHDFR